MNKYHRVTHASEHTRRVWDVTSMRRSTIVEIYEQILSTKTPPDTATTQLAPIHLRVARILLWVFILTLESSPTATQTAVSERFDPLFCSVPKHFNSECTLLIVSLFHDYWMARLSVAQWPCSTVLPTVHGCHYTFKKFPFFCVTLYCALYPKYHFTKQFRHKLLACFAMFGYVWHTQDTGETCSWIVRSTTSRNFVSNNHASHNRVWLLHEAIKHFETWTDLLRQGAPCKHQMMPKLKL